jgi:hypothetical protein
MDRSSRKTVGFIILPALRTGSRASALLQRDALTASPLNATNPVGAYEQREAAIGCAAVVNDVDFTIFASAAHWIASKLTPTRGRADRKSIERHKSC